MNTVLSPKEGWEINPNANIVRGILNALERTGGICPCDNDSEDKTCPCSNYREHDHCCCGLYVKTRLYRVLDKIKAASLKKASKNSGEDLDMQQWFDEVFKEIGITREELLELITRSREPELKSLELILKP